MLQARELAGRLQGLASLLTAEVERNQSTMHTVGTPLTSMLANTENQGSREAARSVFEARDLARYPRVANAVLKGETTTNHARAIAKGMGELPRTLNSFQRQEAEHAFLDHARNLTPDQLPKRTSEVLAQVAPEEAQDQERRMRALEEQRKRAVRRRYLRYGDDGDGSFWFKASLPYAEAEPLVRLIDSYEAAGKRAARDSAAGVRSLRPGPRMLREHGVAGADETPEQRRADALSRIVSDHRGTPSSAGDRPRIVVTMTEEALRERAEQAGLLPAGAQITAGELRRMCCDADLMPVVLGSGSEILDVGREARLVTTAIRKALSARDGGCVFPKCQAIDTQCEAHHVVPWWDGGPTSLGNLALLCSHHHAMIEPNRFSPNSDQWCIGFDPRSRKPVIRPPRRWANGFTRNNQALTSRAIAAEASASLASPSSPPRLAASSTQ